MKTITMRSIKTGYVRTAILSLLFFCLPQSAFAYPASAGSQLRQTQSSSSSQHTVPGKSDTKGGAATDPVPNPPSPTPAPPATTSSPAPTPPADTSSPTPTPPVITGSPAPTPAPPADTSSPTPTPPVTTSSPTPTPTPPSVNPDPSKNPDKEVPPASHYPCFPGAYYRKVVSSFDSHWIGIGGTVRLGFPKIDEKRTSSYTGEALDNFSCYMGGSADGVQEIDAGLTWEFVRFPDGKIHKAWRPFWRNDAWHEAPITCYWEPGEVVVMSVVISRPGYLVLTVSDPGPNPQRVFKEEFRAGLFAPGIALQFKRVNAIDQVHNEGKPVQATEAEVSGAVWLETYLLRFMPDGSQKRLPMTPQRRTDMQCPPGHFHVTSTPADDATGGESIDIFGTPPKPQAPSPGTPGAKMEDYWHH